MRNTNTDTHQAGDITFSFDEKATKCLHLTRTFTTVTLADMDAQQAAELFEFLQEHLGVIDESRSKHRPRTANSPDRR